MKDIKHRIADASSQLKDRISDASSHLNEDNDCTVRALAVALNGDYFTAHSTMMQLGRQARRGCHFEVWGEAFKRHGFELDDVTDNFDGMTVRTLCRELRARQDTRKYVLKVRGHVAAWDGHDLIDWAKGRLHRIKRVYHVRPAGEEPIAVRKKVEAPVERSPLQDVTFVMCEPGRSRDGDYRIYIRENGKVRWLNTKYWEYEAEEAAYRAANRRWIEYVGVVSSPDDLSDYY